MERNVECVDKVTDLWSNNKVGPILTAAVNSIGHRELRMHGVHAYGSSVHDNAVDHFLAPLHSQGTQSTGLRLGIPHLHVHGKSMLPYSVRNTPDHVHLTYHLQY